MPSALCAAVSNHLDRRPDSGPLYASAIEAMSFMRTEDLLGPTHLIYKPSLCIVLQGAKQAMIGSEVFPFSAGRYLAVSVDLPVLGQLTRASAAEPYIAMMLDLDADLLLTVVAEIGERPKSKGGSNSGVFVADLGPQMADCLLRLVQLAETPQAIPILYPAIARELYYWLVTSPHGGAILDIALPMSPTQRVANAIHAIRADFAKSIRIERLAGIARMSVSSFHHHFKAVTAMTPLQFQKQLRLLEARRMMMTDTVNVSDAAYRVGYESPSQFSREYTRQFGTPPKRDVVELRTAAA
jgi:AraC-like DNA-binding protein